MRRRTLYIFDENENKAVNCLGLLGYTTSEAKVIIYFLIKEKAFTKDLEHTTGLRQPQVSVAVSSLEKKGIINKITMMKNGKGRPFYEYHRALTPKEMFVLFEKNVEERKEELSHIMDELRKVKEKYQ